MSNELGRTLSTPLPTGSARTLSADGLKARTPVPLSTETVPGPAGCKHKHEAPTGLVDPQQQPLFNRAQMLTKSSYLVQGSQWSGSYVANHLRISPTHRFFSPENRPNDELGYAREMVENSLELDLRKRMQDTDEAQDASVAAGTDPCTGRSKIFLWEDSGGQCALLADPSTCTEACELPPRIEAFELPCYFSETPERVLIVKRTFTDEVTAMAAALAAWLQEEWGVTVYVETQAHKEMTLLGVESLKIWKGHEEYTPTDSSQGERPAIDLVISLGGDGTTLWISTMFPDVVPPVFGVTLGSLSYLNQFKQDEMLEKLTPILSCRPFKVQLRARLFVALVDEDDVPRCASHCVNECVIDRGPLSTMASIDVYVNDRLFANVSADGLILATPTGSTAYSMSAGGPMVHPNVPCLLFTPISPHSLSMRPLILPDTATLRLRNPVETRNNLWVSLDGRARRELGRDDSVIVSLSPFPFPLVCKSTYECGDAWLQALTDNLNWGLRVRQRRHDTEARCIERLTSRRIADFPLPAGLQEWYSGRVAREEGAAAQSVAHRRTLAAPLTPDELFSTAARDRPPKTSSGEEDSPKIPVNDIVLRPPLHSHSTQLVSNVSEDAFSNPGANSVPTLRSATNGVTWSQLLAGRNRPPDVQSKHSRGYSIATESADSSLDSQIQLRSATMPDKEESPRRFQQKCAAPPPHSRSSVSLHKHTNTHHSPFVQPVQKLRAAIAISPGQPRDPTLSAAGRERSE
eukprot:Gregarina_sp_Pseudo_9__1739@NODE_217_length_3571_cov_38_779162_g202_i0_p1_GENE_NODE_217_length_3571_cov_38_779162_g202_i0NODE_217_length_3571_cov_38_779162_g202_i0_p1_ORF_typecomplete_len748_score96_23NAD_kinase/PF01513_21/8e70_NODE_217_length_3571_cov_38_779162_g202_i012203463